MAVVVSMINMKGGVGKTTLATQLAHTADSRRLRTLAIDLDPQSNLSQAILGSERYVRLLKDKKPTVSAIFENYQPPSVTSSSPQSVDINSIIIKNAGFWGTTTHLDLIPSRLELSNTLKNMKGKQRRLAKALSKIADQYDLILLDCAPTESVLTEAAYHASRYALVPVKPEYMATIGLPLLAKSIAQFKTVHSDHNLDICGIVFNNSSTYSQGPEGRKSVSEVKVEAKKNEWHVYDTQIRYSASYAKAAREGAPIARTSHVRYGVTAEFQVFFAEFLKSINLSTSLFT